MGEGGQAGKGGGGLSQATVGLGLLLGVELGGFGVENTGSLSGGDTRVSFWQCFISRGNKIASYAGCAPVD